VMGLTYSRVVLRAIQSRISISFFSNTSRIMGAESGMTRGSAVWAFIRAPWVLSSLMDALLPVQNNTISGWKSVIIY
ncbi:MAG: hypothetical protein MUO88_04130, partial [Desulfobacterales bacterium]|nr:hypothetical protein [Desulfobacterales bacterium]